MEGRAPLQAGHLVYMRLGTIDRKSSLETLGDIKPGGNGGLYRVVAVGMKRYFGNKAGGT